MYMYTHVTSFGLHVDRDPPIPWSGINNSFVRVDGILPANITSGH